MNKKMLTVLAAGLITTVVSACAPTYVGVGTQIQVTANGRVALANYNPAYGIGDLNQRAVAGSNTSADVTMNASYDQGNWVINGTWKDGFVRFKFKGIALASYGPLSAPQAALSNSIQTMSSHSENSVAWVNGGCMPVLSYYESTNPTMPGTGAVVFIVCDNSGAGIGYNGSPWIDPDYIAVAIPDTRSTGDNSPFVFYESGGTLTGRGNSTSVKYRQTWTSPTATQSPSWTPSSSASTPPPA